MSDSTELQYTSVQIDSSEMMQNPADMNNIVHDDVEDTLLINDEQLLNADDVADITDEQANELDMNELLDDIESYDQSNVNDNHQCQLHSDILQDDDDQGDIIDNQTQSRPQTAKQIHDEFERKYHDIDNVHEHDLFDDIGDGSAQPSTDSSTSHQSTADDDLIDIELQYNRLLQYNQQLQTHISCHQSPQSNQSTNNITAHMVAEYTAVLHQYQSHCTYKQQHTQSQLHTIQQLQARLSSSTNKLQQIVLLYQKLLKQCIESAEYPYKTSGNNKIANKYIVTYYYNINVLNNQLDEIILHYCTVQYQFNQQNNAALQSTTLHRSNQEPGTNELVDNLLDSCPINTIDIEQLKIENNGLNYKINELAGMTTQLKSKLSNCIAIQQHVNEKIYYLQQCNIRAETTLHTLVDQSIHSRNQLTAVKYQRDAIMKQNNILRIQNGFISNDLLVNDYETLKSSNIHKSQQLQSLQNKYDEMQHIIKQGEKLEKQINLQLEKTVIAPTRMPYLNNRLMNSTVRQTK